jgi:1-acyl-sn-glycerol-3-phosphate acyltransferase
LTLVGNRTLHKDGRCVYLCNHRAWADFFVDMYLTEGRAFILSRYLVVYVFPLFAVPAMAVGAVFAFKRNKPGQHDELNKQLDDHMARFPDFSGLVVYPEGTRNIRPKALPLRRGLIKYTWSRQLDVQIIIAADKEHVLSQKRGSASFGVEIPVGYSEVISAKKFRGDFEGFFKEVVKTWDEQWDAVYDSRTKETRPHHPKAQLVEYDTRALVVLLGSVGVYVRARRARRRRRRGEVFVKNDDARTIPDTNIAFHIYTIRVVSIDRITTVVAFDDDGM